MWDMAVQVVAWLLLVFFGGQAVTFSGLVLWTVWADTIRSRLIPTTDIDREADEMIANYADPEAFAARGRPVSSLTVLNRLMGYQVRNEIGWRLTHRGRSSPSP
jgi:hypothetical protein